MELRADESGGVRFRDNGYVLAVLESNYTIEQFEQDPDIVVEGALRECARTDYYYENERHDEDDFPEEDDCNDDD